MAKKVDSKTKGVEVPVLLLEATSSLSENIAQSEVFLRLRAADASLKGSQKSMQLLAELSDLQQKVRGQQSTGSVTEKDLQRLRELQTNYSLDESILEFETASELAAALLKEVNNEISNLLGLDFAGMARRSSGCC